MLSKKLLTLVTLSLSIAVTTFLVPSTCQAIDLVDETGAAHTVPKEKFFVFIFIGHSNVSSVNKDAADGWKDLRAWNYRWDSGSKHTWVQAKETPALGLTRRGTGGPAMVLLKRLVTQNQWKGLHFGIVQNAKPSSTCQLKSPDPWHNTDYDRYKEGKGLHNEIVSLVNEIKGDVTIAGIVVQLGWIETRV
ncbi:MAG: hypothetical protein KAI47_02395, partial [Deltaproteobacteria bacterium]|nr:hypothetical protein [Deltaproteobacteria bacterium]